MSKGYKEQLVNSCVDCGKERTINSEFYVLRVAVKPKFLRNRYRAIGYMCGDCYTLDNAEDHKKALSVDIKTYS